MLPLSVQKIQNQKSNYDYDDDMINSGDIVTSIVLLLIEKLRASFLNFRPQIRFFHQILDGK